MPQILPSLLGAALLALGAVASGRLDIHIGGRYRWEDAGRAYADLEGRRTTGKLLLVP